MGKSTINGPCSMAMLVYAVCISFSCGRKPQFCPKPGSVSFGEPKAAGRVVVGQMTSTPGHWTVWTSLRTDENTCIISKNRITYIYIYMNIITYIYIIIYIITFIYIITYIYI